MLVKRWDKLPDFLKVEAVKPYYAILRKKWFSLLLKRIFDVIVSALMLIVLSPVLLILAVVIKTTSKGPVFYRQVRVTQYGKQFKIFKFRTMVVNADKLGSLVTIDNDPRITKVGHFIRKVRLDEVPQLLNILIGDMTFVGTRPEVQKYVDAYTDEMKATLLLPAGVTSLASIEFKDEDALLVNTSNIDETYVKEVLPNKMRYNLEGISKSGLFFDIYLMIKTVWAVIK